LLNLADLDSTLANETLFSPLHNLTLEWGIYKPNLYFGVKDRAIFPTVVGMLWYLPANETHNMTVRHPYVYDVGVAAYYPFNDGTSASK
jgi:Glycosyl hydrolase family 63 N-terminal domain